MWLGIPIADLEKGTVTFISPCPKCGGIPVWQEVFNRYWILCSDCAFMGPRDMEFDRAIEKWNALPRESAINGAVRHEKRKERYISMQAEKKQENENTAHRLSWLSIEAGVSMLIKRIVEPKAITGIVAIARGGLIPGAMLAHKLGIRNIVSLGIASYSDERKQGRMMPLFANGGLQPELLDSYGNGWLIVDDLVDSGKSMQYAKKLLPEAKTAALIVKRNAAYKPDFYVSGAPADVWVVFPWEEK